MLLSSPEKQTPLPDGGERHNKKPYLIITSPYLGAPPPFKYKQWRLFIPILIWFMDVHKRVPETDFFVWK